LVNQPLRHLTRARAAAANDAKALRGALRQRLATLGVGAEGSSADRGADAIISFLKAMQANAESPNV
jgi:hypothetical protein